MSFFLKTIKCVICFRVMPGSQFLIHMVEAKGVSTALISGVGAVFAFGLTPQQALQFAATTALGSSFGDALLTGLGVDSSIESYLNNAYIDPMDAVGGAVGSFIFLYMEGAPTTQALQLSVLGGLAAALAPKLAGLLTNGGKGKSKSNSK